MSALRAARMREHAEHGLLPDRRWAHRKRRERRPLTGMLLHIDGSRHQWFQDEPSKSSVFLNSVHFAHFLSLHNVP